MLKLKVIAGSKLKQNSPLRLLILAEPDYLPVAEGRVKAQMFARLLYSELPN